MKIIRKHSNQLNEKLGKILLFILGVLFSSGIYSQIVYNNGTGILSGDGTYWVVSGNFTLTNGSPGITTFDNLTIQSGGTLTIASQSAVTVNNQLTLNGNLVLAGDGSGMASLMTNGTVTGEASATTSQRYMSGSKWHLTSSPLTGQTISSLLSAGSNNIAKNGANYALMDYNEGTNGWNAYFTTATSGSFTSGKGYAVNRASDGIVTFAGTIPGSDVSVPITQANQGWNLVGNPFPTALGVTINAESTDQFLVTNGEQLDPSYVALYLWVEGESYDGVRNDYQIINNAGSGLAENYVQMGQGFFVKSKTGGGTISFTTDMRTIQPDVTFKSARIEWPTILLSVDTGEKVAKTTIAFNKEMSNGLDVSFDAGIFKNDPDFSLYSKLVKDNGVDFAIQCLPTNEYDQLVIPIGLDAPAKTELVFKAESSNLPADCLIILEDKATGTYTKLHEKGSFYSTKISGKSNGTGRFYLHTSQSTLGNENIQLNQQYNIVPQRINSLIYVLGAVEQTTQARVFDMNGKLVKTVQLVNSDKNTIPFGEAKPGIYIIQIQSDKFTVNKKISW